MTHQRLVALSLLALTFATGAGAQTLTFGAGPYPVMVRDVGPVVANSFLIRHPASPSVRAGHANFDHPAFAARFERGVDANTFIVGHPAVPSSPLGTGATAPVLLPVASLPIVVR